MLRHINAFLHLMISLQLHGIFRWLLNTRFLFDLEYFIIDDLQFTQTFTERKQFGYQNFNQFVIKVNK